MNEQEVNLSSPLNQIFKRICETYPAGRIRKQTTDDNDPDYLLFKNISIKFEKLGVDIYKYKIATSGQGNKRITPQIAILPNDGSTSRQNGVYIVYFFTEKCDKIFLSLNQGAEGLKNKGYNVESTLELRAKTIRESIIKKGNNNNEINNFESESSSIPKIYDSGNIYSDVCYEANNIPSEKIIKEDLDRYLKLLDDYSNNKLLKREVEEIVVDNIIKTQQEKINPPIKQKDQDTNVRNFFEYLRINNYYYPIEVIEDFLLSLKAKQFVIFCGGSGSGKTKLALLYGKYISKTKNEEYTTIEVPVTLKKADTNGGFTLSADTFFDNLPYNGKKAEGLYKVKIGDLETECDISIQPRLWYTPNKDKIVKEIIKLKDEGHKKTNLCVYIPISSTSEENYALIPVGSNWTESRFIIGFKNALTGKYNSTQSLDLMIKADDAPTDPHILILDEMNLSHVERYFSDILSAMESGEPIKLDTDGAIPKSIELGKNLFIVGTVNVDETTYAFSPKVLDRANVMEFDTPLMSDYINDDSQNEPNGDIGFLENCMSGLDVREMNAKDIISVMKDNGVTKEKIDCMTGDITIIQKHMENMGLPFSFRTIDEIMRFMYVAWIYSGKGNYPKWKRFLDSQIKQKILPKIHGNMGIRDDLDEIHKLCVENGYVRSEKKIERMIRKLDCNRYVTFNS